MLPCYFFGDVRFRFFYILVLTCISVWHLYVFMTRSIIRLELFEELLCHWIYFLWLKPGVCDSYIFFIYDVTVSMISRV